MVSNIKLSWEILWNNKENGYVGAIICVCIFSLKPLLWVEATVCFWVVCCTACSFTVNCQNKDMEAHWLMG